MDIWYYLGIQYCKFNTHNSNFIEFRGLTLMSSPCETENSWGKDEAKPQESAHINPWVSKSWTIWANPWNPNDHRHSKCHGAHGATSNGCPSSVDYFFDSAFAPCQSRMDMAKLLWSMCQKDFTLKYFEHFWTIQSVRLCWNHRPWHSSVRSGMQEVSMSAFSLFCSFNSQQINRWEGIEVTTDAKKP